MYQTYFQFHTHREPTINSKFPVASVTAYVHILLKRLYEFCRIHCGNCAQ